MKVVYSPKCLEHYSPYEPKERVEAILEVLKAKKGVELVEPAEVDEKDLLLIHSKKLVEDLKFRSATGMGLAENPFDERTFGLAKIACGCALRAAEIADEERFAFALTRPPGHHAGREFYHGFCYMNNIAFAVRKDQKKRRALIVDFDVHHGDGTQDIFAEDKSVFYMSLHQHPHTLFPYRTGFPEENSDHVKNVPLHPGMGDREFVEAVKEGLESACKFAPEFVAVSAGFDAYEKDSIASLQVRKSETFGLAGKEIRKLKLPTFGVLEGGYYLPDLGKNLWSFLSAFE